jgi:hypothetical protein
MQVQIIDADYDNAMTPEYSTTENCVMAQAVMRTTGKMVRSGYDRVLVYENNGKLFDTYMLPKEAEDVIRTFDKEYFRATHESGPLTRKLITFEMTLSE